VISLTPTIEVAGQFAAPERKTASSQRVVASGLTVRPGGRSTRSVFKMPTGSSVPGSGMPASSAGRCLTMNCVMPKFGCPAACV
jgi:hypothetical protein